MSDINIGALTESINNKMDRDAHNVQNPSAVVIASQMPTEENGYTWYRKYSDGWVEQGGQTESAAQDTLITITLPVEMSNANYYASATNTVTGHGYVYRIISRTVTSFIISNDYWTSSYKPSSPRLWQVSGQFTQ